MARKSSSSGSSSCAFCEKSNLASICASCVNYRVNEYSTSLKYLQNKRNLLYRKLEVKLLAKKKLDDQRSWRMVQNDKIAKLRERLNSLEEQLTKDKAMVSTVSNDLKARHEELESSFAMIAKKRVEMLESCQKFNHGYKLQNMAITDELLQIQAVIIKQICELFPMQRVKSEGKEKDGSGASYYKICNARLPRGLDPHSVPAEELAASLGYMVQLLNLVIPNLAAPALHNSGFAGSCSRIWQRNSYWDARPSSRSKEYPLFILRQNFCSSGVDISWSDRSSSNFGVASVESDRKPYLSAGSSSFNYSFASSHSVEIHIDLQKGISLLKKSVACVTAYVNDSLGLNIPSEVSTFEAFARLLVALSSQEKMKSVSLKIANPRNNNKARKLNNSVWNASSTTSSGLEESTYTVGMPSARDNISKLVTSFLYSAETTDCRKSDCLADEWDLVEHSTLPPPPSQVENVEHWTRAMFIDVTKKC